jgi:glutathione S-transferase
LAGSLPAAPHAGVPKRAFPWALSGAPIASWEDLQHWAALEPDRINGPASAQATLRLFGQPESSVRVTLYRDHHAWCPYCQKVWLWLEEKRIPYRVRKVTMVCYGQKESWYRQLVPSGMLPALELDGQLITESDRILLALEAAFGPLRFAMEAPEVLPLRQLERLLFRAWCQWLCVPHQGPSTETQAAQSFDRMATAMAEALGATPGPFLLGEISSADLVFVPYVERMGASLAYYKGYLLRRRHAAIDRWFRALEERPAYLATQSDFHTHAHDLPPQMGGCYADSSPLQHELAERIDHGPWPIAAPGEEDPETSQPEPPDGVAVALARVLRHRRTLVARYGDEGDADAFATALRCALTLMISGSACPPPGGTAAGLRSLAQRISVPRDMPLHAARSLRQALLHTAALDPLDPLAPGHPLPLHHRRDQDPQPFLLARRERAA